jgi:hypothetical protein
VKYNLLILLHSIALQLVAKIAVIVHFVTESASFMGPGMRRSVSTRNLKVLSPLGMGGNYATLRYRYWLVLTKNLSNCPLAKHLINAYASGHIFIK